MLLTEAAGAFVTWVNAGYIITARGTVVVDALASLDDAHQLRQEIRDNGGADPVYVVNTHFHPDHVTGNQAFEAPVIAHQACTAQGANPWFVAVHPEITFSHGLTLQLGGTTIHIEHLGGHTACSSTVYLPDHQLCYSGDLLFVGRYPFVKDASLQDWVRALQRLAARPVRIMVPGHGPVLEGSHILKEIQARIDFFQQLLTAARRARAQGMPLDAAANSGLFPELGDLGRGERWLQCVERAWTETQ
ncbi:MAG: MBL fold metallo-hydrolase [Bacillota bacterium]